MKRKIILILIIIAAIIVGLVSFPYLKNRISDSKRISVDNARLDKAKISPGEEAEIYVSINNKSKENDAKGVSVRVVSPSKNIVLSKDYIDLGIIGAGGSRSVSFSISVLKNAYEGKYRIKIKADAEKPFRESTEDVYLEVKAKG